MKVVISVGTAITDGGVPTRQLWHICLEFVYNMPWLHVSVIAESLNYLINRKWMMTGSIKAICLKFVRVISKYKTPDLWQQYVMRKGKIFILYILYIINNHFYLYSTQTHICNYGYRMNLYDCDSFQIGTNVLQPHKMCF